MYAPITSHFKHPDDYKHPLHRRAFARQGSKASSLRGIPGLGLNQCHIYSKFLCYVSIRACLNSSSPGCRRQYSVHVQDSPVVRLMLRSHLKQQNKLHSLLLCLCLASVQQATVAVQQQQLAVSSLSSSLPIIDGWVALKTTTHISYSWSQQFLHVIDSNTSIGANSTGQARSVIVPTRGTNSARIRTSVNRTASYARFGLSGSLRVTNPDPLASIIVDKIVLQCQWGLEISLPCAAQQQQQQVEVQQHDKAPVLVINPGETAQCHVHSLAVPAAWGTNFKQSCRVIATTPQEGLVHSGHFMLDFASPHVMRLSNDCARVKAQCDVTGSSFFETLGAGEQLQQGMLVCANKTLEAHVVVNDVYAGAGEMPDSCSKPAKVRVPCDSMGVMCCCCCYA